MTTYPSKRVGVIVIACKKDRKDIKFLVLKRKKEREKGWEMVKGGIEKRESIEDAGRRELKEETNISKILWQKVLRKNVWFSYPKLFWHLGRKFVLRVCVIMVKEDPSKLEDLFEKYEWLKIKRAFKRLKWPEQKYALKIGAKYTFKVIGFKTHRLNLPFWLKEMFLTKRLKKSFQPPREELLIFNGNSVSQNLKRVYKKRIMPMEPFAKKINNVHFLILLPGEVLWKK